MHPAEHRHFLLYFKIELRLHIIDKAFVFRFVQFVFDISRRIHKIRNFPEPVAHRQLVEDSPFLLSVLPTHCWLFGML